MNDEVLVRCASVASVANPGGSVETMYCNDCGAPIWVSDSTRPLVGDRAARYVCEECVRGYSVSDTIPVSDSQIKEMRQGGKDDDEIAVAIALGMMMRGRKVEDAVAAVKEDPYEYMEFMEHWHEASRRLREIR